MNGACRWFDNYRDGELDSHSHAEFQSHLQQCERCRSGMAFLNNLKVVIEHGYVELPENFDRKAARHVFQQNTRWDTILVSWLRPAGAWLAFAAMLLMFGIWELSPFRTTGADYGEYEVLLALNEISVPVPLAYAEEMLFPSEQEGANQ